MTTKGRMGKGIGGRGQGKEPMPLSMLEKKARHLPMFGPGLTISVPLHLLPAYMEIYHLHPMSRKEIHSLAEQGIRKPEGVLWVRREAPEETT